MRTLNKPDLIILTITHMSAFSFIRNMSAGHCLRMKGNNPVWMAYIDLQIMGSTANIWP